MSKPYLNGIGNDYRQQVENSYATNITTDAELALSRLTRGLCPRCDIPLEPKEPDLGGVWVSGLCPCCCMYWEAELLGGAPIVTRTSCEFSVCRCVVA